MSEDHHQTVGWPGHNHIQPRIVTFDRARVIWQRFTPLWRPPGLMRARQTRWMIREP